VYDARIGDIGIGTCCCHKHCRSTMGQLITGSPNVRAAKSPTSRLGDIMLSSCGHIGIMVTASAKVRANKIPTCRLGDSFTGCFNGVVVTGAPNVIEPV